jgi:ribosomal protein L10
VPHQGRAKIFFETVPTTPRVYPQRKAYLFGRYKSLLQNSKVMLVFQNNNLSSEDLSAVKAGVYGVKKPEGEEGIIMEMIRGGILSGAIKKEGPSASASGPGFKERLALETVTDGSCISGTHALRLLPP